MSPTILNGGDVECVLGLSPFQIKKAEIQGRHVLKALQIVDRTLIDKMSATWHEACERASDELVPDHCSKSFERWFVLRRGNTYKIKVTDQGKHAATKDFNPFTTTRTDTSETKENDDLCKSMRAWGS